MILDQLDQAACYYGIGARVEAGLRFLRGADLAGLANGRQAIDGDAVYALVSEYQTKSLGQGQWEAHRRYLDIQCLISGEEKMGYAPLSGLKVTQVYDAEKDCLFLEGLGDFLVVKPKMFILFMPQDAHLPGLAVGVPSKVKKVVVKVRV